MALESAEDAIEAALFDPEPALKGLNHLPMGMRIFQVHVKRGRISDAGPNKTFLAAPEFHAALEARVEDPLCLHLSTKALDEASFPRSHLLQGGDDKDKARGRANVMYGRKGLIF